MAIDSDKQVIYVFGGRAIAPEPTQVAYSGLYAYNITRNTWKLIRADNGQADNTVHLKSRIGHSMLLNSERNELYIFAGQRAKDYLSDFYVYNIANDTLTEVSRDYSKSGGPDAGFTQRATFDAAFNEIYVLSGLMKDKASSSETVRNSFWVFQVTKQKWTKIYQNENTGQDYWESMKDVEPCPRYAHQLVYDHLRRKLYLFGGNPGSVSNPKLRLDDFWELGLERPSTADVLRKAKLELRQLQFKEMCLAVFAEEDLKKRQQKLLEALHFLKTQVHSAVDHRDVDESQTFRQLTQWLFMWNNTLWANAGMSPLSLQTLNPNSAEDEEKKVHSLRTGVYESLLKFFPERMKEPVGNLVDSISFE